jgi:hypothetical protein
MKTNKIFFCTLLIGFLILNLVVGCTEKSDDPKPDNFQSIIGKWVAKRSIYNITKQDGSTFQSTTEIKSNGITIIWEFFADGRLVVTKDGKSEELRWSLKVSKIMEKDIEEGKLTIISAQGKALATSIGQSGDLVYDISTVTSPVTPTVMSLDLDVTKIGPYKKNILASIYEKQK